MLHPGWHRRLRAMATAERLSPPQQHPRARAGVPLGAPACLPPPGLLGPVRECEAFGQGAAHDRLRAQPSTLVPKASRAPGSFRPRSPGSAPQPCEIAARLLPVPSSSPRQFPTAPGLKLPTQSCQPHAAPGGRGSSPPARTSPHVTPR